MVQGSSIDLLWAISAATAVLLFLSISIIAVVIYSKRKEMAAKAKQLEELKQSEQKYRSIFENSLAGIVKFSLENWEVFDSNKAMKQIFGCLSDEDLARCFSALPRQSIQNIQQSLLSNGLIQEYEIKTTGLDSRELWILFSAKIIGEEHLAHGVIIDITERKMSQDKIAEQAMLLDEAQDAIIVTDYSGHIKFWNNGAELIYGWTRKQASGSFIRDLIFDTGFLKEYDLAIEDLLQFGEWYGEQHHLSKEGDELLVQSRWKKVESALTGKRNILIVNTDITEKKRQELRLLRAQKMESIALLTGGIAHDLQNVLAPVSMSINLLREKMKDEASSKVLNAVEESAKSGLDLIRNIVAYGHGIPGERESVNLSDLLDSILTIVKQSLPEAIHITIQEGTKSYTVLGDINQLKQVFLNIIVNARDAMPGGGELTVGIEQIKIDEISIDRYPDAHEGEYYLVSVRDTGQGIPEDCIERIFEPFYTTKANGNGTGLGLSIALGIIKSHSGFITVNSVLNKGTEFRIYLPVLQS